MRVMEIQNEKRAQASQQQQSNDSGTDAKPIAETKETQANAASVQGTGDNQRETKQEKIVQPVLEA